jgi:hypothetical protein
MKRRGFLKFLGTTGVNKGVEEVLTQPAKVAKNTVSAVRDYDRVVKNIKKDGGNIFSRRNFLNRVKKEGGILAAKRPKQTLNAVKKSGSLVKNLRYLDPMNIAEVQNKINIPKFTRFLKMFSEDLNFLCDFSDYFTKS